MSVRVTGAVAATAAIALTLASAEVVFATGTLDYEFYKTKVQPIFLAKRPGHAPCVVCHAEANNMFRLEKLRKAKPLGLKSRRARISRRFRRSSKPWTIR